MNTYLVSVRYQSAKGFGVAIHERAETTEHEAKRQCQYWSDFWQGEGRVYDPSGRLIAESNCGSECATPLRAPLAGKRSARFVPG